MAKYLFLYHGVKMATDPKMREKQMADWMKWVGVLGKALVDGGAPVRPEKLVNTGGVADIEANPAIGYSILEADSLDGAIKLAKGCPTLSGGGQVAIYSVMPM